MSSKIIVVVDDKLPTRELLRGLPEGKGYSVVEANTNEEALKAYGEEKPDMVLLDFRTSGKNGSEILHSLKAIAPETSVIMITGVHGNETGKQAMNEGAVDDNTKNLSALSVRTSAREKNRQHPITLAGKNPHAQKMLGGSAIEITSFPFRIGRKSQSEKGSPSNVHKNNLNLDDPRPHRISRNHFQIEHHEHHFFVRDLGSRFGLLVNAHPIGATHRNKIQKLVKGENTLVVGGISSPYRFIVTV